jgi:hypothetical protein
MVTEVTYLGMDWCFCWGFGAFWVCGWSGVVWKMSGFVVGVGRVARINLHLLGEGFGGGLEGQIWGSGRCGRGGELGWSGIRQVNYLCNRSLKRIGWWSGGLGGWVDTVRRAPGWGARCALEGGSQGVELGVRPGVERVRPVKWLLPAWLPLVQGSRRPAFWERLLRPFWMGR